MQVVPEEKEYVLLTICEAWDYSKDWPGKIRPLVHPWNKDYVVTNNFLIGLEARLKLFQTPN